MSECMNCLTKPCKCPGFYRGKKAKKPGYEEWKASAELVRGALEDEIELTKIWKARAEKAEAVIKELKSSLYKEHGDLATKKVLGNISNDEDLRLREARIELDCVEAYETAEASIALAKQWHSMYKELVDKLEQEKKK